MSDEFATPATATGIPWEKLNGRLLLFTVKGIEHDINTEYGTKDAIRADMDVIDGDVDVNHYSDGFVFPLVLQSQLRQNIGGRVLGRLGQGVAKGKQKPPWKLTDPNANDQAVARAHLATDDKPPW